MLLDGLTHPQLARFVRALEDADGTARTRPDHLTASAVVLDPTGTHVLLVLHKKVGRWLQPGGHIDPEDASLAEAALREATEETGVSGLVVDPSPVHLDAHAAPCGADTHLDVQFLAVAPGLVKPVVSEESLNVQWWPLDALPEPRVDLSALLAAGLARLRA